MKTNFFILFLILGSIFIYAQQSNLKSEALKEMQAGRYGEAIDVLNRYISAYPQEAEGYNLRGVCYEKRNLYEMAVYDFRSARKLKPDNREINTNLSRATDSWYKLLYNKIEGHKREIAINPNRIINYLEIGKSYKNLGEWLTAEEWYDKYLKLEEPSSDEVIRYTEILAKNNHITKGEPILKRFTEKFPQDHRIWSRYGYFSLWLGKNKIAIEAFQKALELRPYFKEAMDGLDQAKGKGYIYTINDTSYNGKGPKQQEYAIDKYYRQLKKDPSNSSIRAELIKELLKANRLEEAYTESSKLDKSSDQAKYTALIDEVKNIRIDFLNKKVSENRLRLEDNPNDFDAILSLAELYDKGSNLDSANVFYSMYLDKYPDNNLARYNYIRCLASSKDFQNASENMNILIGKDAANPKFQLLQNQLLVWTNTDLEKAKNDLQVLLNNDKENQNIIVAYAMACIKVKDFNEAEKMIVNLQKLNPDNTDLITVQDNLEFGKLRAVQDSLWANLEVGRKIAMDGDCRGSLPYFEDYLAKADPNVQIENEYADVLVCANEFDKAISVYDKVLNQSYDLDADIGRAKAYFYKGDSARALDDFLRLRQEIPNDISINLFLVDVYQKMKDFDRAQEVLDSLNLAVHDSLIEADSTQLSMIAMRYKWMEQSGGPGFLSGFGNSFSLTPFTQVYGDDLNFFFNQTGARFELGITSFLGAGVFYSRSYISTSKDNNILNTFKGTLFVRILQDLIFSGSLGNVRYEQYSKRNVSDAILKYEKTKKYQIYAQYEFNDARMLLYSPNLMNRYLSTRLFALGGYYNHPSGFKFSSFFQYITVSDANKGNHFQARIGRKFYPGVNLGYEYDYQNYGYVSKLYYSPKNIQSHSIWGEWNIMNEQDLEIQLGGKLGYIPSVDFLLSEVFGEVKYMPFPNFTLSGKTGFGSSYRFDTSYNSYYLNVSAYWSF